MQLNKKEGKICSGGAKYAVKEYLPLPSKMSGVTFQNFVTKHALDACFNPKNILDQHLSDRISDFLECFDKKTKFSYNGQSTDGPQKPVRPLNEKKAPKFKFLRLFKPGNENKKLIPFV